MSIFGQRLKELRFKSRLTQKEVADELGMTFSALSQYENGKRTPKNDILIQLSTYYNVSVDYLLGLDDNPIKTDAYNEPAPSNHIASSSDKYIYTVDEDTTDSDITLTKTRVLNSINRLPKQKQLEILTAIELLLDTVLSIN